MSLRIFSAGCLLLLAACGDAVAPGNQVEQDAGRETATATPAGERIACAIGDGPYADTCSIERAATQDGTILTIRHPDGGFRRLILSADGRTVTAADGAQPVAIVASGDGITEVAIADARYRLPAKP